MCIKPASLLLGQRTLEVSEAASLGLWGNKGETREKAKEHPGILQSPPCIGRPSPWGPSGPHTTRACPTVMGGGRHSQVRPYFPTLAMASWSLVFLLQSGQGEVFRKCTQFVQSALSGLHQICHFANAQWEMGQGLVSQFYTPLACGPGSQWPQLDLSLGISDLEL